MSDYSSGEELSEHSDFGMDDNDSPKFGEEKGNEKKEGQVVGMYDLRTAKLGRNEFQIAEDEDWPTSEQDKGERVKTFYKQDKPGLISRSSSSNTGNEGNNTPTQKISKEIDLSKKRENEVLKFNRKSDLSSRQGNENDELKFMLSHSNTFLTSEVPEEYRQRKDNIIDIDEDSNEDYEEVHEHLSSIDKKLQDIYSQINDEGLQRKQDVEQLNDKLDRILSLLMYTKNEPDFTKYRTNTFVNTSIPKPNHQKSSIEGIDQDLNPKKACEAQEFENSEALLNNMIESKLRSEGKAKEKMDTTGQKTPDSNEVRPFEQPGEESKIQEKEQTPQKEEVKSFISHQSPSKTGENNLTNTKRTKEHEPILLKKDSAPTKTEIVRPESIHLKIADGKSENDSETSSKLGITDSKIYHSEEEFMKSFLEEIKEESSNINSNETPQPQSEKVDDDLKRTLRNRSKSKKPKKKKEPEADPLDLLGDEFDIVDQTIDNVTSAVDESGFQDTIIGSKYSQNFNLKSSKGKENKVPSLKLKTSVDRYTNHRELINLENETEDLIDMFLSEEGEIHEESIIQFSENNIKKHTPVKIKKDRLVKVDPVERYQEFMKNSQKEHKESLDSKRSKPINYFGERNNDEESVKLDDVFGNKSKIRAKQNTDRRPQPKVMKNIFFDVHSEVNDNDGDQIMSLLGSENYDEQSIQSQNFVVNVKHDKPMFLNASENRNMPLPKKVIHQSKSSKVEDDPVAQLLSKNN
jgi:hypothetical protein